MKKILALVLVVIMCAGLCACSDVKQEVYDTLKAGYDEVSAKYDELKSKVDKYSTVIEALEKEDYDGAVEAVNAMRPAPKVTEIEITMDNLWDYFEITETREEKTDANGNMTQLKVNYDLALKKEFKLADEDEHPTDIALGYEYDEHFKGYNVPCTVNYDTFTCDGTTWNVEDTKQSNMAHYPQAPSLYFFYAVYDPNNWAQIITISDFKTINASGILYLVNK